MLAPLMSQAPRRKPEKPAGKRTTISLTDVVAGWADEQMQGEGYENFSAYVAELIRRDYKSAKKAKFRDIGGSDEKKSDDQK